MALDSCHNFVNLNAALRLKNANNFSHFNIYEDICNAPPSVEFYSLFAKGKLNPDWCGSLSACADSHTCIAPIVWHIKKQAPSERVNNNCDLSVEIYNICECLVYGIHKCSSQSSC